MLLTVDLHASRDEVEAIIAQASQSVHAHLPNLDEFLISAGRPGERY